MTVQEKKKFLGRCQVLDAEIRQATADLREWRLKAALVRAEFSGLPKGGRSANRTRLAVDEIARLEERLDGHLEELVRVRVQTEKAIKKINDPMKGRLLKYRYVAGFTWEKIAGEMEYSLRHIMRLHRQALDQFCP